jgi:hypothetical protein
LVRGVGYVVVILEEPAGTQHRQSAEPGDELEPVH